MQSGKGSKVPDINITPLVDVMLVLLVIFMITTPIMTGNVLVNVPSISSSSSKNTIKYDELLNISLNSKGELLLNNEKITIQKLKAKLEKTEKTVQINLEADKNLPYYMIYEILNILKQEGFEDILLGGIIE